MKSSLLEYLACPGCENSLQVEGQAAPLGGEIRDGVIRCPACGARFPVTCGIPRFASDQVNAATERTRRVYNFTWRQIAQSEVDQAWDKDSYEYAGLIPTGLTGGAGKVGLDAGCGGGADLRRLAMAGSTIIGVDLSDGVETAASVTASLPNVGVVQGDLLRLPFRPGSFDFIYSFGVLHHLPDPAAGFKSLAQLLKPGAPLITYLYEDFSDRSSVERGTLAAVRAVRHLTSRLPPRLLYTLCWAVVPLVWIGCSVPAHALRRAVPRLAGRIPFRHTLKWPVLASDLFDRFAPPVEWRFDRDGVRRLYEQANLTGVEIQRYRGWVSWGFKSNADRAVA